MRDQEVCCQSSSLKVDYIVDKSERENKKVVNNVSNKVLGFLTVQEIIVLGL